MNNKNKKILVQISFRPISTNIKWDDIESLFVNLGAEITEGNGSRIRIKLNGISIVLHKPHPRREIDKGALVSVYKFLKMAGLI